MTDKLIIALAQLNPTVGAIAANLDKARGALARCEAADLVLFPELFICGYPPEDLVLRPSLVAACKAAVEDLARDTITGPAILMGLPWREDGKLFNAVALLANGRIETLRFKHDLPNYGVFDEKRYSSQDPRPVRFRSRVCGSDLRGYLDRGYLRDAGQTGAEILLVPNGSPFNATRMTCGSTSWWRG